MIKKFRKSDNPTIIYIMGYGYSGSTFFDTLLGNCYDIESVGELNNFYRYTWNRGKKCGCGKIIYECEFWSAIDRQWRQHLVESSTDKFIRAQRRYEYYLNPFSWMRLLNYKLTGPDRTFKSYATQVLALYGAISKIGQKSILIDSSKSPARGAALMIAGVNIKTIHLIRDSRAVVWSKLKRIRKVKPNRKIIELLAVMRTAIGWAITNSQSSIVSLLFCKNSRSFVKYEDLMIDPLHSLDRLKLSTLIDIRQMVRIFEGRKPLQSGHIVCGNQMRKQGWIAIAPDFEWQTKLPLRYKILTTLLTFPFLLAYRYKIRPAAIDDR